ncbi:hypothetical protein GCM10022233_11740 [Streptomyces shaanxiensis]|uniref:Mycothiol-dependent maleylpyruvate isomerase metal-binding domain-containing protein n=1 Tax=Streptomyces shaanxiensis TaxID=653357 RepID=A0ABP7UIE0_9ACTN
MASLWRVGSVAGASVFSRARAEPPSVGTMTSADVHDVRDPELPGRLLVVERDALVPLLRARSDADFALPTVACPGWSVRDVLAHCSAALMRVVEHRFEEGVFSPESNDRDIAERADWTNARVVDELERGMTEAGPVIAKAGGALDGIALGMGVPPRL